MSKANAQGTGATTRRGFVSGLAMAALGAAAAGALEEGGLKTMVAKASDNEAPDTWGYEYGHRGVRSGRRGPHCGPACGRRS